MQLKKLCYDFFLQRRGMKRVAVYCRVSTKEELQLHSIQVQQAYYEKWARKK